MQPHRRALRRPAHLDRRRRIDHHAAEPIKSPDKGTRKPMNKLPGFGLIERARALAPLIASEADEIERTRRLTPKVVSALIENGLYRVLLPQSTGGSEAPLEIFMQMLEEVAKADASTAWCLGQCSVCAMTAAYLDPEDREGDFWAPDRHPGLGRDQRRGPGRARRLSRPRPLGFRQRLAAGELARRPCPGRRRRRQAAPQTQRRAGNPHHPVSAGAAPRCTTSGT